MCSQPGCAPSSVIEAIAKGSVRRLQRHECSGKRPALLPAPAALEFVQHRHLWQIGDIDQRESTRTRAVGSHGDCDASEPAAKRFRIPQLSEPPKSPQLCLPQGVARVLVVPSDLSCDGVDHPLRALHQLAACGRGPSPGSLDQAAEVHSRSASSSPRTHGRADRDPRTDSFAKPGDMANVMAAAARTEGYFLSDSALNIAAFPTSPVCATSAEGPPVAGRNLALSQAIPDQSNVLRYISSLLSFGCATLLMRSNG
jgi:hypothetical protein